MDQSTGPTKLVPVEEFLVDGRLLQHSHPAFSSLSWETTVSGLLDPSSPQSWNAWLATVQFHPDWEVIVGSVWPYISGWTTICHFSYRTRESRTEEHAERDLNTQGAIIYYSDHLTPVRNWLGSVVDHMANVYRHEMEEYLIVAGERVLNPHRPETARRDPLGL